jgi:hypothetical protein
MNGEILWERDTGEYWGTAPDLGAIENHDVLDAPGPGATRSLVFLAPVPNPTKGTTRLRAQLPGRGRVRLEIVDVQGRHVRLLHDGALEAGPVEWTWDGRDDSGAKQGPGVYFARLRTPLGLHARRIVQLR